VFFYLTSVKAPVTCTEWTSGFTCSPNYLDYHKVLPEDEFNSYLTELGPQSILFRGIKSLFSR